MSSSADTSDVSDLLYAYGLSAPPVNTRPRIIPVAAPSVASEWSTAVPGGVVWVPLSVMFTIVTDANAANRIPQLIYTAPAGTRGSTASTVYARTAPSSTLPASQTAVYNFARGRNSAYSPNNGIWNASLPALPVIAGDTIGTTTGGLQVGDQYSAIVLTVLELSNPTPQQLQDYVDEIRSGSPQVLAFPGLTLGPPVGL